MTLLLFLIPHVKSFAKDKERQPPVPFDKVNQQKTYTQHTERYRRRDNKIVDLGSHSINMPDIFRRQLQQYCLQKIHPKSFRSLRGNHPAILAGSYLH